MNEAVKAVYLFIAELNGYKGKSEKDKITFGEECYFNKVVPEMSDEALHTIIWLERLYAELNKYVTHVLLGKEKPFHWSVPIELDASASMLGYQGALLGDSRLLTMVNMAGEEDALNDPWSVEGVSRNYVKAAAMPLLYGSSQSIQDMWSDLDYTREMLESMQNELREGAFGLANMFKEFIINNCNPTDTMDVVIDGEEFTIECNHWKKVGEVTIQYDLYDTGTARVRRISHTKTKAVADLERFRRFFVTLLIHGLDSQVADRVAGKVMDKYGYCIDVHDA